MGVEDDADEAVWEEKGIHVDRFCHFSLGFSRFLTSVKTKGARNERGDEEKAEMMGGDEKAMAVTNGKNENSRKESI